MRRIASAVYCLLFVMTLSVSASATEKVTLASAHSLFFGKYENHEPGVVTDSGLVFSIVNEAIKEGSSRRTLEMRATMQAARKISNHYKVFDGVIDSGSKTLDRLLHSHQELKFNQLASRVLVNRRDGDFHRYVLVMNEADIQKVAIEADVKELSPEDIDSVLTGLVNQNQLDALAQIFQELNLPELALFWKKKQLSQSACLANYYQPSSEPFVERSLILKVHNLPAPGIQWLCQLPGSAYVIQKYLEREELDSVSRLVFESTMLPALQSQDQEFSTGHWGDMQLDYIFKLTNGNAGLQSPFNAVKSYPGLILFSEDFSSQPNQHFEAAKAYFDQGINLGEIIVLLEQSINESPLHIDSWQYLGAALQAKQSWNEAASVYLQWVAMQPDSIEAIAKLSESLYQGGFIQESERFRAYLQFYAHSNRFAENYMNLTGNK